MNKFFGGLLLSSSSFLDVYDVKRGKALFTKMLLTNQQEEQDTILMLQCRTEESFFLGVAFYDDDAMKDSLPLLCMLNVEEE
jgi:hypothetical protein